jgi:hypothetical protein
MQIYTAIALLSLLGITLSANAARAFETPLPKLETATAEHMLSTQAQQRRSRPPSRRPERPPNRGDGRRDFTQPNVDTDQLQNF